MFFGTPLSIIPEDECVLLTKIFCFYNEFYTIQFTPIQNPYFI